MTTQEELNLQEIQRTVKKVNEFTSNIKIELDAKQISRDLYAIENHFKQIPKEWKTIQRFIFEQIDNIKFNKDETQLIIKQYQSKIQKSFKDLIEEITSTRPQLSQALIKDHYESTFKIFSKKIIESTNLAQNQDIIKQHLVQIHNQLIAIPTYKNIQDAIDKMMNLKVPQQNEQLQDKVNSIIKINQEFESAIKLINLNTSSFSSQEIQQKISTIQQQLNDTSQIINSVPQALGQISQLIKITNNNQLTWEQSVQQLTQEILKSDYQELIKSQTNKQYETIKQKQELFQRTLADSINQFLLSIQSNQLFLDQIIGEMKNSEQLQVKKRPNVIEIRDTENEEHHLINLQKQIINALTQRKYLIVENYFM